MFSLKSAFVMTMFLILISKLAMSLDTNNAENMNKNLTELQKYVVFENGTEKAFDNEYWNNKKEGIYIDVVSGKPLFSSKNKFVSGTGWPSFTKPIDEDALEMKRDSFFGFTRTEVRARQANIHLGHVFDDGPKDKGGKRYCINSASLKFVEKDDLEKEGYGSYLNAFNEKES